METECIYIPHIKTNAFSKIILDYLEDAPALAPFYANKPNVDGIKSAIENRKGKKEVDRVLLVAGLREQYFGIALNNIQEQNLAYLLDENTFTITTAHQPNLFTGPLYFIYKIFHAIKLASELCALMPNFRFVPIYYMGSEDADLDELGYINLFGEKRVWGTDQKGAVGRMKLDQPFFELFNKLKGELGVYPFGAELIDMLKSCFTCNKPVQQAMLEFVNLLFAQYGLLVIVPDRQIWKKALIPVIKNELLERFSHRAVNETLQSLSKRYKIQATGRVINLFYLIGDRRERIEYHDGVFHVKSLSLSWDMDDIIKEVEKNPKRFSPNVITRGLLQETLLPNLVFIGGGGELSYWLELKKVFEGANIPYPILVLRNSFLWVDNKQKSIMKKLGIEPVDLFLEEDKILQGLVERDSIEKMDISNELEKLEELYKVINEKAKAIDTTLSDHVISLQTVAERKLIVLQQKMLRAEKKKFELEKRQISTLKNLLFPNGNLQERHENFMGYYARFGQKWLDAIYQHSKGIGQCFGIIFY